MLSSKTLYASLKHTNLLILSTLNILIKLEQVDEIHLNMLIEAMAIHTHTHAQDTGLHQENLLVSQIKFKKK